MTEKGLGPRSVNFAAWTPKIPCEEKSFKNKTKWTGTLASYQVND